MQSMRSVAGRHNSRSVRIKRIQLLLLGFAVCAAISTSQALPRPQDDFRANFATSLGAPLITPLMEEVTLEVNSNYSLRCEASEPITWKLHNSYQPHVVQTFDTLDPERPYGSILHLSEISFMNVGNYYCIKESGLAKSLDEIEDSELVELVNTNIASTIYIYVNDPENLLVPIDLPVGYAHQFEDFTIPCKPTMANIEVLLTTSNGDTYSSENTGRYSPQRGFVIQIRGLVESGMYICRPKIPSLANEDEQTEIDIHFVAMDNATTTTRTAIISTATAIATETLAATTITAAMPTIRSTGRVTNLKPKHATTNHNHQHHNHHHHHDHHHHHHQSKHPQHHHQQHFIPIDHTRNEDHFTNYNAYGDGFDFDFDFGFGFGDNSIDDYNANTESESESTDIDTNDSDATSDSSASSNDDDSEAAETVDLSTLGGLALRRRKAVVTRTTQQSHRKSSFVNNDSSTPPPATSFVNKPKIISEQKGHAYVGDTFNLTCEVQIVHDVAFNVDWTTPPEVEASRLVKTEATVHKRTNTHNMARAVLTVKNTKLTDSGNYKCTIIDHSKNRADSSYSMKILKNNETYINMSEPSDHYNIVQKANKTVIMFVQYTGFPIPTLTWYRPDGQKIEPTRKYVLESDDKSVALKILQSNLLDSGVYVLNATNGLISKHLKFNVMINDLPIVELNDVYVQEGEEAHLTCRVLSYPKSNVTWEFTPCGITPRWPSCDKAVYRFEAKNPRPGNSTIEVFYDYTFTPRSAGLIRCIAHNKETNRHGIVAKAHVLISDINDNMTVYGVDENRKIARDDEVTITCVALAYYFSDDLIWYKDGEIVHENADIVMNSTTTKYSFSKSITFKKIQDESQGTYECIAKDVAYPDRVISRSLNIFVHEPTAPTELITNIEPNSKMKRKLGDSVELICNSYGVPRPTVKWFKDDLNIDDNGRYTFEADNSKLLITFIKPDDEGTYKCIVSNRLGTVDASVEVKITNLPGLTLGWIMGFVSFLIILIALVIYLSIRVSHERKVSRELKAAGLANFEEGAVEHINPALTLDEQAELLPYDRNFEFPREKLKLGNQLGAGAFGVVLKAHAEGIKVDEKESVVAVKMVKRTADNEVMRALVSELKIMVHLGQHLNVVNLLGAVTKNIAKRELMVIVEYCRYGNVQNFLLRNRKRFIDQIHPETNKIDPTITTQRFSDNFELNRNSDNDPRSGTRAGRPNSAGYLRESDLYEGPVNSCATEQTVMTTIPEDDDNVLSNNSVQPAWRSNYKPDSTEAMSITTSDLVSWAFQVARGMEYLSSRKVLHGDLAARNILLCEDNVVKICDFGLARTMYKSDNYKKQGEAPLPIKWLALESLSDHVFSTYTDVWSFGIVMWEFFSLAKVPYPGMNPNQSLYLKLKDGYRMEKPPFANDELYDIMLECWSTNPESRPLFHILEKRFARMLGDEVTSHYVDLNDPYLRVNTEYMKQQKTDYLALMGSPDEMAPPPPKYVNGQMLPEIRIDTSSDEYLQMSPNTGTIIFSPTRPKDYDNASDGPSSYNNTTTSFTFPPDAAQQHSPTLVNNLDSPVNKSRKKNIVQPEEIPMLHSAQAGSDGKPSPEQIRKFGDVAQAGQRSTPTASPRQCVSETEFTGDSDYVNVKSPKKHLNNNNGRAPEAFSNPSYQMLKTVTDDANK